MTQHISQEDLVLHYYGEEARENAGAAEVEQHLAACEACRAEFRSLQRVLNTVESLPTPDRSAEYGSAVWQRIAPQLGPRASSGRWRWLFSFRTWSFAAAMAAVVVLAFLAGRHGAPPVPAKSTAAAKQTRERILLVAVGDHLERSQMVLAELVNAGEPGKGGLDVSYERQAARDLVESNRLYRLTAASTGDASTASLLDELERVLLDIANGPSEVTRGELDHLRSRIEDQGILFKVRVYASQVQRRERSTSVTY
jgi:hypothetical protein